LTDEKAMKKRDANQGWKQRKGTSGRNGRGCHSGKSTWPVKWKVKRRGGKVKKGRRDKRNQTGVHSGRKTTTKNISDPSQSEGGVSTLKYRVMTLYGEKEVRTPSSESSRRQKPTWPRGTRRLGGGTSSGKDFRGWGLKNVFSA